MRNLKRFSNSETNATLARALTVFDTVSIGSLLAAILWLIWKRTPQVPFLDEFATVDLFALRDTGALTFTTFWEPHNGHRILIPKVISFVLITLTGYNRQIEMTFNLVFAVTSAALFAKCIHLTFRRSFIALAAIAPVLAGLVLSVAQYENWMTPFAVNLLVTVFGVALSTWALYVQPEGPKGFILALVGIVVASLSSLAGLAALFVFLPYLRFSSYRRRPYLGMWVIVALTLTILYFHDYSLPEAEEHSTIMRVEFIFTCLGAPVATTGLFAKPLATTAALICGVASFVLICMNAVSLVLLKEDRKGLAIWITVALFAGVSVFLITGGRSPEMRAAMTPRYQAFTALWWLPTIVLTALSTFRLLELSLHALPGRRRLIAVGVVVINIAGVSVAAAGLVRANVTGFREASVWQSDLIAHQDCIRHYDIAMDECLRTFIPRVDYARDAARLLERHHYCIFRNAEPNPHFAGSPPVFRIEKVGLTRIETRGYRTVWYAQGAPVPVWGWAIDPGMRATVERVIVTVDGVDAALAEYGEERPDLAEEYRRPQMLHCGFHAVIDAARLKPGPHNLGVRIDWKEPESTFRSVRVLKVEIGSTSMLQSLGSNNTQASYNIDVVREVTVASLPRSVRVSGGQSFEFGGWAVDHLGGRPAGGVIARIDQGREILAAYGIKRPDVAGYFRTQDYLYSGFSVVIPAADLTQGRHTITLFILAEDQKSYYIPTDYVFSVGATSQRK